MMRYFATFTSGCQEIIASRLQNFSNNQLKVEELHDGLVIFSSDLTVNQLSELRFFTNIFGLTKDCGEQKSLEDAAGIIKTSDINCRDFKTFATYLRQGSQPASSAALGNLQNVIAAATGAQPTSFRPDLEFLLWLRDDKRALFGWRLPLAGFKKRSLEAGELRPEVAHIMGLVAALSSKHVVLDPFAGYGAIVRECLQGFHCQEVIAVEHNEHLLPHLKSIPHLVAKQGDAARLPHIVSRSIDRVITDPPWGRFEASSPENLRHLYFASLQQMHRVLRSKGCAVILTGVDFLPELAQETGFIQEKQYNILVSGQKATLYKLRKLAT